MYLRAWEGVHGERQALEDSEIHHLAFLLPQQGHPLLE